MPKFVWGKVIDKFDYDFDGVTFSVVKYHPNLYVDGRAQARYSDEVRYHCDETSCSCESVFELLIHWLAYKQLGLNEGSLVAGICKALDIK